MVLRNILFPRAAQWVKELHTALKQSGHDCYKDRRDNNADRRLSLKTMKGESN
jgi:hypothetical protein